MQLSQHFLVFSLKHFELDVLVLKLAFTYDLHQKLVCLLVPKLRSLSDTLRPSVGVHLYILEVFRLLAFFLGQLYFFHMLQLLHLLLVLKLRPLLGIFHHAFN